MVKKIVCTILSVIMAFTATVSLAQDVKVDFAEELVVSESETVYRNLKTKEDGNIVAKITVPDNFFDSGIESAKLYVASYNCLDAKELDQVAAIEITPSDAGKEVVTPVIALDGTETLKAFLWDGKDITPISAKNDIPKKEPALNYTFENFNIGDTITDSTIFLSGSNVTAASDPEPNGTRGTVAKFLGIYDCATDSIKSGWSFSIHELKYNRSAINARGGTVAVDYTYDLYIPSEYAYDKADGSDYKNDTIFQIKFGEYRMAGFQMMICTDNNRIQFQNFTDGVTSGWVNYQNWKTKTGRGLYDRWIQMKVETRPFVTINPETGKEVVSYDYSESTIYFDDVVVGHVIGKVNGNASATNTGFDGIEGRLYFSCNKNSYSVSRAVYMDNFKISL